MKTIKKDGFTVYLLNNGNEFRIKQISDSEYIIEKFYAEYYESISIWRSPKKYFNKWFRVDDNGDRFFGNYSGAIRISNSCNFTTYKTKESAIKWIEDFEKYPIIH